MTRPTVKCVIELRTSSDTDVADNPYIKRVMAHLNVLSNARGYAADMVAGTVQFNDADDSSWLQEIRESGYPGKARDLLMLPTMRITVRTVGGHSKSVVVPSSKLRSSKVFDPLAHIIASLLPPAEAVVSVPTSPSPAADSIWRWKPDGWVESKTHGPGATTCFCRRMARKELTREMRGTRRNAAELPSLLPNLTDDDMMEITETIRKAMRSESSLGMQLALTKDYTKAEQAAYCTGVRLANHSAALKIIKAFPGSNRAAEMAKELDSWSDY